ncbi:MAG TPA: exonuclease SbcCD subunit D [Candidatus Pacearchaeota archaeon]|nr:exonuclease SbcCD subunit D [Candidatus Pacearchaeota archaeon]
MVRFAHIADVHLGGWKQQPMQNLNFESFKEAVNICITSKLDFVLFSGDLFDSAYPPIEILKETFAQFKRLKDAGIPCFTIAGSHDYSVSGKTFLDVLEKAGFCKNVYNAEEKENSITLNPVIYGNVAIYGYPGRKSGLEIADLKKVKFNDAPGLYKIFMLHTIIDRVVGTLPIESINPDRLPHADYYALGHIHVFYSDRGFVYPGPLFPNNFKELEDLKQGSFVIVDTESNSRLQRIKLPTKQIEHMVIEIEDALTGTEKIIYELNKRNLKDKIILLRVYGELKRGKSSNIKFSKIEEFVKGKEAYFLLRNTHDLISEEQELDLKLPEKDSENIEEETIKVYSEENPSSFNKIIPELMNALSIEKQEGETTETFNNRILQGTKKFFKFPN